MPPDHLPPASEDPVQLLRRRFVWIVPLYEGRAWNESETLDWLSARAISAVAGESDWTGCALSPEQVIEAMASLPAGLRSRLHAYLVERDSGYWSGVRLKMPTGGAPGYYSEAFLDAAERLRAYLHRIGTPPG